MTEEFAPLNGAGIGRWLFLAVLLFVAVAAHFAFSSRVPPIVVPYVTSNQP